MIISTKSILDIFRNLARGKKVEEVPTETRTAIRSQKAPDELQLTEEEKTLADSFDRMPRSCRRVIERSSPKSWTDLETAMKDHPHHEHRHG